MESPNSHFSYDVIPYASYAFEQTCPENLAAIARLFGLEAPDFTACRVLELGCASGGNILPLAELYPGASFLGIDLSVKEVTQGRGKGLEYLGDTDLHTMLLGHLPKQVAEKLKELNDIVQTEQYMDFFRNRRFRHTLLCHREVSLKRNLAPEIMEQFYIYAPVKPDRPLDEAALRDGENVTFSAGKLDINHFGRCYEDEFSSF